MKSLQRGFTLVEMFAVLFTFGVVIPLIIGWVWNIVKIVELAGADVAVTTMFILRCVGVFLAPLGGILGWM